MKKITITFNSDENIEYLQNALIDIVNQDALYICILNYDYDLKDVEPSTSADLLNGMYFADNTGTSKDPYIAYEFQRNSNFFGANF